MNSNMLNRRTFVAASLAFAGMAAPAAALSENEARVLIDTVVTEINRVIASGQTEAQMIKSFETIFVQYADVPIMAQYVLGNDGRSATAAQKRDFTDAFQGYISRKYGKRFREFIGGQIEVQGAREIKAGYEITTTAYLKGEAPFEVIFLVSGKSGRDLFFNMFIEGVNVLLTERTEIGAMLDKRKGDMGLMIADLRQAG
jgi:phospholipid transport system substrate-binding protein